MLTESALRKRKWGPFPALRQVLETAPPSTRHYGFTSVSDNVFDQLQRLVDIASRAEEQKDALLAAVRKRPELRSQMIDDLRRLRRELEAMCQTFNREIDSVTALCEQMHRLQG